MSWFAGRLSSHYVLTCPFFSVCMREEERRDIMSFSFIEKGVNPMIGTPLS